MVAALLLCLSPPPAANGAAALAAAVAHPAARAARRVPAPQLQFDAALFEQYAPPPPLANLSIVEFPSPLLRAKNEEVREFDEALADLSARMLALMYAANGVGLAAPQVGVSRRLFVYNPNPTAPGALRRMGERVVANPQILQYCEPADVEVEGCLSSRSECCCGAVRRASEIHVRYQDEKGRAREKRLRGFEARVFQHEYDHIEGVLHLDRQSPAQLRRVQPFLEALVRQHGPGGAPRLDPSRAARLQPPPLRDEEEAAPATQAEPPAPLAERPLEAQTEGAARGFGGGAKRGASKRGGKPKKKR
ncbi:hypothetical protein AB1Y20_003513 [Prymnesium parvum]|uniref:Peptide deformylase n=1 Tax=Prymnesium parvum TaxID=97485 RepID=A0AB34J7X2_PRYPA